MCSSGGPMADIDLKKLKTKKYQQSKFIYSPFIFLVII